MMHACGEDKESDEGDKKTFLLWMWTTRDLISRVVVIATPDEKYRGVTPPLVVQFSDWVFCPAGLYCG